MSTRQLSSIRDSYLYSIFNHGNKMDNLLKNYLAKSIVVDASAVDEAISNIRRYFKYPLVNDVLNAFTHKDGLYGKMLPIGSNINFQLPPPLPFFLAGSQQNLFGIAVLDRVANYAKDDSGRIDVDPKKLYVLLESAYIARVVQQNFSKLNNTTLYTEGASVYAHMLTRVLNKLFALNVDKVAFAKVLYLTAKYYFLAILKMQDNSMVQNYALKVSGLTEIAVRDIEAAFKPEDYATIATFITKLQESAYMVTNTMKDLTVRGYVEAFCKMYGDAALFALENFNYFIFNIASAVNGGFLNNQYAFDDIIGKSGDKLYAVVANFAKGK